MLARFADPAYAGIRKVRLRTPVTAQRWIDLAAPDPAPRSRVR